MSGDTHTQEIKRRLSIFFQNDEELVDRYVQKFGMSINMRHIQTIRNQQDSSSAASQNQLEPGKNNPVYDIKLDCPVCQYKGILHRELRASALTVRNDPFLAPVYFPVAQYQALNYLTVNVAVCPRCLMASPDKRDFIQFNRTTKQHTASQIQSGILSEIQDTTAERMDLLERLKLETNFSLCPRPFPLAIASYQLADLRAQVEQESKVPFSIYKRANYWLRIALLQRQAEMDDQASLDQALQFFQDAFYRTDFPNPNTEFQACFLIFSLYLKAGENKKARDYMGVMEQSRKKLEEAHDHTNIRALDSWMTQAKNRWNDRDLPDLWDTPTKA